MANAPTPQFPLPSVSASDILTTIKNIVVGINGWATTDLNVAGNQNSCGMTAPTLVKGSPGRVAVLSVIVAGSGAGTVYDATSLTDTSRPLCKIPTTAGVTTVNMACSFGIVVAPGSGQTVSVGFS